MKRIHLVEFFVLFVSIADTIKGDDWPQFLGPNRNGISAEKGLIESWPEKGIPTKWKVDLGEGMSGISVAGERLVTMYQDDDSQYVVCISTSDGKQIWKTAVAKRYENSMGHGPRATPSIHEGKVFSYSGDGILTCMQLVSGKIVWSKDCQELMGTKPAEYGMASSPLVWRDQVFVTTNPGSGGGTLVSFSTSDGKLNWKAGDIHPGYSSPVLFKQKLADHVLLFGGSALKAIDATSGEVSWSYPFSTEYNCNTATPVQLGNELFISSGENHGSVMLSIRPGDADKTPPVVSENWKSLGRESTLRSEWQTPVLYKGHLYGMDNVGSAGPITNLVCVDAATGKQKWIKKRFGKGNLILADGKLIISTMKGQLFVVEANPDEYRELGRQQVIGQTRQAPVLANGRVYLRDNRELVCLDLRK